MSRNHQGRVSRGLAWPMGIIVAGAAVGVGSYWWLLADSARSLWPVTVGVFGFSVAIGGCVWGYYVCGGLSEVPAKRDIEGDSLIEKTTNTIVLGLSEGIDRTLDELMRKLGKTNRADIFRIGIALLKVVAEAEEKGLKLTLANEYDVVQSEIVLPD